MKIIFLDIDGVLNSRRSMFAKAGQPTDNSTAHLSLKLIATRQAKLIDPVAIAMLNRLTDAVPSIKLVISSTHRFVAFTAGKFTLSHLQDYVALLGITGEVIGATPRHDDDAPRGEEIAAWLKTNSHLTIDRYVVLDDDDDIGELPQANWVLVDGEVGLTMSDVLAVQQVLGITNEQLYGAD